MFSSFDRSKHPPQAWDWVERSLIGNVYHEGGSADYDERVTAMAEEGADYPLDFERSRRNAEYDETQLYAVYNRHDVYGLVSALSPALHLT